MSASNGPDGITAGLIYCIDAGNTKSYSGSGTNVTDLINGISSTLTNGPGFSSDAVGNWTFDGSNDYISVDNSTRNFQWTPSGAGNNTLCFELWVKSTDSGGGYYISKPWNGNGEYNILLTDTGWSIGNSSGGYALTFSALSTGNWEHIVAIATPTQSAVYRNGRLNVGFSNHGLTVNTPTSGDFNNTIPLAIMTLYPYGSWAGNTGFSIQGSIGLVRVYNRLLTSAEVLQNYTSTRGRFR